MAKKTWTLAELCDMPSNAMDARNQGLKYYYPGTGCRNGHLLSPYRTSRKTCVECNRETQASYKKSPKGKKTNARGCSKWRANNLELARASDKVRYYQAQLDKSLEALTESRIKSIVNL